MLRALLLLLLVSAVAFAASCGDAPDHEVEGHAGHVHAAPHGGVLVVLAEEALHVELLLDATTGTLSLFVLGPHADAPLRIAQPEVALTLRVQGAEHRVALPAVASELTGETVGDTSQFAARVDTLVGAESFSGTIDEISARGSRFSAFPFTYP